MIRCCSTTHLSQTCRSNPNLISFLKNARRTLKRDNVTNSVSKAVRKRYDNINNEWLEMFPKEFFRKVKGNTKMASQLYLVNETTAAKIAKHLTSLPDNDITFVETNPGLGLLTSFLIESGMKDLRLFEGRKEFLPHLYETYTEVHPDRAILQYADLIGLHKVLHMDNLTGGTKADDILSALPVTEWQNNINFRLFCATGSTSFFRQLIHSLVLQNGIMALGRCEMYVAMPSVTYLKLTSSRTSGYDFYRSVSVLFQIFFEYQILDKFPRFDFLPYVTNPLQALDSRTLAGGIEGVKMSEMDPESMYLVKIVPRRDLYQMCPSDQIAELWHFVNLAVFCRSKCVIPLLEKLIPGCGARLLVNFCTKSSIRPEPIHTTNPFETPPTTNPSMTLSNRDYYNDLNIFSQAGELQPSQWFTLFHEFRSLPEYSSCSFLPSLESVLLQIGAKPDEIDPKNLKSTSQSKKVDEDREEK